MAKTIALEVVSQEKLLYSGETTLLIVPGVGGELGIMPKHIPLLTKIKPGLLKINLPDGGEEMLYVSGGILEVQPDKITVLADFAERGDDLDEERAEAARKAAEDKINAGVGDMDYAAARAELAQAIAQIQAIRKLRRS